MIKQREMLRLQHFYNKTRKKKSFCRPNNLGAFLEVGEKMYTVQLTYLLLFIF